MSNTQLQIVQGNAAGQTLEVAGELVLGRAASPPGHLGGDPELSRRHARLVRQNGALVVEDLGSTNGTAVNGARIAGPVALNPGDRLRVGATTIEVVGATAAAARPTPPAGPAGPVSPPGGYAGPGLATEPHPAGAPAAGAPAAGGGPGTGGATVPPPGSAPEPGGTSAVLVHQERRYEIPSAGLAIGRAPENDVVLATDLASRQHARVDGNAQGWWVTDLRSSNGTVLNGERLVGETRWLQSGDRLTIGGEQLLFLPAGGQATQFGQIPDFSQVQAVAQSVAMTGQQLRFGRDPSNDVPLQDPNVSRFHAEVVDRGGGRYVLRDLGSRNGTRLNGQLVREADLVVGSEIGIGPFRLVFDGAQFVTRDDRGSLRLDATNLTVRVEGGRKTILHPTSIAVDPGEFVCIIGESGSGKSTMIKALAGVNPPSDGVVTVNGDPVSTRLFEIGYVPQDEIVHRELSVREALTYAAKLRLPQDSTPADLDAAVGQVVDELALQEHAETRVGRLSGGQRKRAGVGTELVNRPGLLFLDEPTTGLDPQLEGRMMELMRDLARGGRAVITITHATKNLGLCDKVAVMGRGGHLAFYGRPADALTFFGVSDYDEIYLALEATPATAWKERFLATQNGVAESAQLAPSREFGRPKADRKILPQARILTSRYAKLMLRDKRNLAILFGQIPVLALAVALVFGRDVLTGEPPDPSSPNLMFLLVTLALWFGSIDAVREVIRERTVVNREHAVGVRTPAYLVSKVLVLFAFAAIQIAALTLIVAALRPFDVEPVSYAVVIGLLVLTAWAGVAMGLLISAAVTTENQATSFLPLALIPQLLLAGAIQPIEQLSAPMKAISVLVFSRWAFAGTGTEIDYEDRLAGLGPQVFRFGDFFSLNPGLTAAILVAFTAVFLAAVAWQVKKPKTG